MPGLQTGVKEGGMSLLAEFRGWYPYWLSQLRSWTPDEALAWGAFTAVLSLFVIFNFRRLR
jgi:hypothetical protein